MWKSLKRLPVLLALLVAFGGLAVGLAILPGGRVTATDCARIQEGMTEDEVIAVVGKPWESSLLDPPKWLINGAVRNSSRRTWKYIRVWVGDEFGFFAKFDGDGRVVDLGVVSDPNLPRSSLPAQVWRRLSERYRW
jgi:hypothetical protein